MNGLIKKVVCSLICVLALASGTVGCNNTDDTDNDSSAEVFSSESSFVEESSEQSEELSAEMSEEESEEVSMEIKPDTYYLAPVYEGDIENEKAPKKVADFIGAIYHKVVSSADSWLGIEAVVTLPEFTGDENRTGKGSYGVDTRYLDNPSVYLGCESKYISDCGLTWSPVRDPFNRSVIYADGYMAYRPFWRYQPGNTYKNANVTDYCYYYYPGDTVRMSLYVTRPGYLRMRIELLEETTIEKYASWREKYNLKANYPKVFTTPEFESAGVGELDTIFRRVNAIDQVNNEGKATQKTKASSVNTSWKEVYLYREISGDVYKVPMTSNRYSFIDSPVDWKNTFEYSYDGIDKSLGGETISINP